MDYPTLEEVEKADRIQICNWHRYLPSPGENYLGENNSQEKADEELIILNAIVLKFKELGGFTPEISKYVDSIHNR